MEKIRVGIIGVGLIGKMHLDTYAQINGVEVVAASGINETELIRVAEEDKIQYIYCIPITKKC